MTRALPRRHQFCTPVMLVLVLLGAGHLAVAGQQMKYGVSVKEAKPAALAKAKTYIWTNSQPSFDKDVDRQIVAAVDRELAARGFTKLDAAPSDVVVTYASLSRTDTDLKSKPAANGMLPGVCGRHAGRRHARPGEPPVVLPRPDGHADRQGSREARGGHQRGRGRDVREVPETEKLIAANRERHVQPREAHSIALAPCRSSPLRSSRRQPRPRGRGWARRPRLRSSSGRRRSSGWRTCREA